MDYYNPERTAKEGIEALKRFLKSIGMPINFAELGAKKEDIPHMVDTLCFGNGRKGTVEGFITLTPEVCKEIYNLMV